MTQPLALNDFFGTQPFLPKYPIIPANKGMLSQTQIMFDHPYTKKAVVYQLNIYEMKGKDSSLFRSVKDSSCATLLEGFEFGKSYKWNYVSYDAKNKVLATSSMYDFTILPLPNKNRVRVIVNDSLANQGGLISFDYHCMITNRRGTPIWFLPDPATKEFTRDDKVRDLRITPAGTCTFITQRNAFEIVPDGRILWRAPKSGPNTMEILHHGIERLPNGNLMTLGNHTVKTPVPNDTGSIKIEYGVIGEYDHSGKLVWKWDSYNYLQPGDIEFRKLSTGEWVSSSHMNAFRVSADGKYVYAGFRDLDRIVMIDKERGVVVESYGRLMPSGAAPKGHNFFHAQHDIALLSDGMMAVFNNDSITKDGVVSSIVVFGHARTGEDAQIAWRFACNFDKLTNGKSEKGGSVDELPNGNLLVNFGTLNRCIEISRDGKIVWDAFTESFAADSGIWRAAGQYRSHYSSSLYPCYFTAAIKTATKKLVVVDIWNEGTEPDAYYTERKRPEGTWERSVTPLIIGPGEHKPVEFARSKSAPLNEIRIVSATNAEFVRLLTVN